MPLEIRVPLCDFVILGGASVSALDDALRESGFTSSRDMSPPTLWLRGLANGADIRVEMLIATGRVPIYFYSETELMSVYTDIDLLRKELMQAMFFARRYGHPLVVTDDGWPLPPGWADVVSYSEDGTDTLVGALLRMRGKSLIPRMLEGKRLQEIGNLYHQSLSTTFGESKPRILIFGPAKPRNMDRSSDFDWRLSQVRETVIQEQRQAGFLAVAGEDLENVPPSSQFADSLNIERKEMAVAGQCEVIVVLAASYGAISEITSIRHHPKLCPKTLIFVCEEHKESYANLGPIDICVDNGAQREYFTIDELHNNLDARIIKLINNRIGQMFDERLHDKNKR